MRLLQAIILLFLLLPLTSVAQWLNSYTTVTQFDPCTGILRVQDTAGFFAGQRVILMQMKGASINENDGSSFGTIQTLGGAGVYEVNVIDSIDANNIRLGYYPKKTFDVDGIIQLISYPDFDTLVVTDTLQPKPWDGQTGGVLAFSVSGLLDLQAPLDASGRGFRGGPSLSVSNSCVGGFNLAPGYYYPSGDFRGATKGEGVAILITGKENGRGAQANGGGGGNDHNAGGGGGGHLQSGGDGGERDTPFFTTACKGEFPGKKGRLIPYNLGDRLFPGGGGGAGHGNNNAGTDGGHGGGIVIVKAHQIRANGQWISSCGSDAKDTKAGDGAGGGGAGGQLFLDLGTLTDTLFLSVKGGNGGSVDNIGDDTCFGPGGGGSGGTLLINFSGPGTVQTHFSGGQPGRTTNSASGCNGSTNGAEPGTTGSEIPFQSLQEAILPINNPSIDILFSGPLLVCRDTLIEVSFSGYVEGGTWEWNTIGSFQSINQVPGFSDFDSTLLRIQKDFLNADSFELRFVGLDYCGRSVISDTLRVIVIPDLSADFSFIENGLEVSFSATGIGGNGFWWQFGDGSRSFEQNPVHTFPGPGDFRVSLHIFNSCDTVTVEKVISLQGRPMAGIRSNLIGGCSPLQVQFESAFTGQGWQYDWIFPGGSPASSAVENPLIEFAAPGMYDVRLIVSDGSESDTLFLDNYISVLPSPQATFQTTINGFSVDFFFTGVGNAISWDFGDGNTSNLLNPVHVFAGPGTYTVGLIVENFCGKDSTYLPVEVGFPPSAMGNVMNREGCTPLTATWTDLTQGQKSRTWFFEGGNPTFSTDSVVRVRYEDSGLYSTLLVVENDFGIDSLFFEDAIDVAATPVVDFGFTVNGLQVNFENLSVNAGTYRWNFGDGSGFNTMPNPVHTFPAPGQYFVTLEGLNTDCSASLTRAVDVQLTNSRNPPVEKEWKVYPNPFRDRIFVEIAKGNAAYTILDMTGKQLESGMLHEGKNSIFLRSGTSGFQVLKIQSDLQVRYFNLIRLTP